MLDATPTTINIRTESISGAAVLRAGGMVEILEPQGGANNGKGTVDDEHLFAADFLSFHQLCSFEHDTFHVSKDRVPIFNGEFVFHGNILPELALHRDRYKHRMDRPCVCESWAN